MAFARGRGGRKEHNRWREQAGGLPSGAQSENYCPPCHRNFITGKKLEDHRRTTQHHYNYFVEVFNMHRARKVKDRHGVQVVNHSTPRGSFTVKDGTLKCAIPLGTERVDFSYEVQNRSDQLVELSDVRFIHQTDDFKRFHEDANDAKENVVYGIEPNNSIWVKIRFTHSGNGLYRVPISFTIERQKKEKKKTFYIIRIMEVFVQGLTVRDPLAYESPFKHEIWEGIRFRVGSSVRLGRSITEYSITPVVERMIDKCFQHWRDMPHDQSLQLNDIWNVVNRGYSVLKNHYSLFFHTLLYLEEYDALRSIEKYNMTSVKFALARERGMVTLEVPGLGEKRPSLIRGDIIYARLNFGDDAKGSVEYEAVIFQVRDSEILVNGFNPEFLHFVEEELISYDVRFTYSRYPIAAMHKAIDDVENSNQLIDIVFPENNTFQNPLHVDDIQLFNKNIESNVDQKSAVINILQGVCRPSPYIIYGPPGTGKTVTIVEAILQIKKLFEKSYILVCAPSNAACDFLTQKLKLKCKSTELLRYYSSTRDRKIIPEDLLKYSNVSQDKISIFPKEKLYTFRIVVCTLISAKRLHFGDEHFTHVFIDECGQAKEPETLVAVSGILGPVHKKAIGGQLIIAGDPHQLGPVCQSSRAQNLWSYLMKQEMDDHDINYRIGLGVSFLERLMEKCQQYQKNEDGRYDNRLITKLLLNYRSHPLIMRLSNEYFYENELEFMCSDKIRNDSICERILFGKKRKNKVGCPVVFHNICGNEEKEGNSPSYFNEYEVDQVMLYVEELLKPNRKGNLLSSEIGIIAPYIRQVYKIKKRLENKGLNDIEVGTTEIYQGREKRVIIITTVRANANLMDYDHKYHIGFLSNSKRFNVAVTRAQSLLIVIGHSFMIGSDFYWRALINHCKGLGSSCGWGVQFRNEAFKDKIIQEVKKTESTDD